MQLYPQIKKDEVKRIAHRLPCTIHSDGDLPTARAYCPFPEPLSSFRGRKMQNATYQIPPSSRRELPLKVHNSFLKNLTA